MVGGGASYFGNGIYKSEDNGVTWLPKANGGNVYTWDNDWEYVNSIGISPSDGTIFAAVNSSILRSTDGGTTWERVLGTGDQLKRSELTVNSAGHIYASISSDATNPGIYKSTTGGALGSWTSITPAGFPTTYERVVLAHAPSDNNIVYLYAYSEGFGKFPPAEPKKATGFWKYDASGGSWVDRSANLPTFLKIPVLIHKKDIIYLL